MTPTPLTSELVSRIDTEDLLAQLMAYPANLQSAFASSQNFVFPSSILARGLRIPYERPHGVVIVGMGGSGVIGSYLRDLAAPQLDIPVVTNQGRLLPAYIKAGWLVLCISYSGDTYETLENYREALARGSMITVIASGGKIIQQAARDNVPYVQIPPGSKPRMAIPFLLASALVVLEKFQLPLVKGWEFEEAIEQLNLIRAEVSTSLFTESALQHDAARLKDRIIVAYGAGPFSTVAYRFKCQLNENAKMLAWAGENPEICHNEVVGWEGERLPPVAAVLFRDETDPLHVRHRDNWIAAFLRRKEIPVITVAGSGKSLLSRLITATYRADLLSYYLAVLNKVDPGKTSSIASLKEELKTQGL